MTGTTMGIVPIACIAARAAEEFGATMTSTPVSTSSRESRKTIGNRPARVSEIDDDIAPRRVTAFAQALVKSPGGWPPNRRRRAARGEETGRAGFAARIACSTSGHPASAAPPSAMKRLRRIPIPGAMRCEHTTL
ncbi:MAG: hypothetical protein U1F37_16790 [Alphaproteobacteria bacterium]